MDIVAISGGRYRDAVQPPVTEDEIHPVEPVTSRVIKEKTSSYEDLHIWSVVDKVTISARARRLYEESQLKRT